MPSRKKLRVHEKMTLKLYKWKNHTLKPDTTVELSTGDFLFIKSIIQQHESIFLSGIILRRNSDFKGKLLKKLNELCFLHQKKIIDGEIRDDSLEELEIREVLKVRELVRTNKRWEPRFRSKDTLGDTREEKQQWVRDNGVLTVRWKFVTTTDEIKHARWDAWKMKRKFVPRRELSTLTELDCTPGEYVLPNILRLAWRGETVEGGDGDQVQASSTSGSRKTDRGRISNVITRYTFGDMYCGAGGAICGAEMAGLQIRYGLDSDTDTGLRETWTNAFPKARFYHTTAEELIAREDEDSHLKVDVLHLSPPCQFYSRPKTTPSEKDANNRTQIFFTGALLQKGTPRIVILEKTAGLLDARHERAFNQLLLCFTQLGFSITWDHLLLQDLGLPQSRARLVILAAWPGEPLPQFPKLTHLANPDLDGLKPHRTPCNVLRSIPVGCDNHELTQRQIKVQQNNIYKKWNPHQIVSCITCNGEACTSHPSGKRGTTRRETAALQGFPHWFTFRGTKLRVQIGNAVPPSIAKIVFTTVRKHLETVDGIIEGSEDETMDDEETEPDGPDHECVADRELEAEATQLEGTDSEESEETELEETEDGDSDEY